MEALCHSDVPASASSETYVEVEDNAVCHLCLLNRMMVEEDATFPHEILRRVLLAEVVAPVAPEVSPS